MVTGTKEGWLFVTTAATVADDFVAVTVEVAGATTVNAEEAEAAKEEEVAGDEAVWSIDTNLDKILIYFCWLSSMVRGQQQWMSFCKDANNNK